MAKLQGKKQPKHPLGLATHIKKQTPTIFQKKLLFKQGEEAFNMAYLVSRQYLCHKQTSSFYGDIIHENWGARHSSNRLSDDSASV